MEAISVIIPVYNRRDKIIRAISSVLNQTYPVDEIIVVYDGSADGTYELVANRFAGDSRIKCYRMQENRGAAATRNYGVKMASNELIAFQDSDDIWLDDKIEKQMGLFSNPETVIVYSPYYVQQKMLILMKQSIL